MELKKSKRNNGEVAVAVVKFSKLLNKRNIDMLNYTHPGILEIIPAWKTTAGKYISVETGEEVNPGNNFQERSISLGTEFQYPNGDVIILVRDLKTHEQYFAPIEGLKGGPRYNICPYDKEKLERVSTLL